MGDRRQRADARARRRRRLSVCRRRRADVRADGQRARRSRPIRRWSSRSTCSSATCRRSSGSSRAASSRCGRRRERAIPGWATCRPRPAAMLRSQGSSVFGGPLSRSTALTFGFSGQRSDRFLDPVHPDNLHNSGNAANGTAEFSWLALAVEHAVHRRRRRSVELRRSAQRRSGRGGPGSAADKSADLADRVMAASMVGRHGVTDRRLSPLGLGGASGHRARHAAVSSTPIGRCGAPVCSAASRIIAAGMC